MSVLKTDQLSVKGRETLCCFRPSTGIVSVEFGGENRGRLRGEETRVSLASAGGSRRSPSDGVCY